MPVTVTTPERSLIRAAQTTNRALRPHQRSGEQERLRTLAGKAPARRRGPLIPRGRPHAEEYLATRREAVDVGGLSEERGDSGGEGLPNPRSQHFITLRLTPSLVSTPLAGGCQPLSTLATGASLVARCGLTASSCQHFSTAAPPPFQPVSQGSLARK